MTPQKSWLKMSAALILIVVIAADFLIAPFNVYATVPVVDDKAIGVLKNILKEDEYQSSQLGSLVKKERVEDPLVKILASLLLQTITQTIIEWIQDGGNTNFVSNLESALKKEADDAAGEFLNNLAGINLCEPFDLRIKLILKTPSLRSRLACSATDIFNNLDTSYNKFLDDFTKGGWVVFQSTLVDSNNYIDSLINSYDAKLVAESRPINVTLAQYNAGQGFLGTRIEKEDCSDWGGEEDKDGNPICRKVKPQTTPGTLVADQLKKVFSSGIDQAVATDEISEAIDAIITAAIFKLVESAAAGLASNDEESGIFDPGFRDLEPPPSLLPDLAISKDPAPTKKSILAGDIVRFTGIVENQGGEITATTFKNRFEVDIDYDGDIDVTLSPHPTITALDADEERAVTSGSWTAVEGTHRVILCADEPDPLVEELLETNNCNLGGTGVFTVGEKPDLVISENPKVYSGELANGQSIIFSGIVENQGGGSATSTFQNRFQVDLNNDGTADVTLAPNPTIASLDAKATKTIFSSSWTASTGTHRVILCADTPSPAVLESSETNNCNAEGTGVFTIEAFIQQSTAELNLPSL